jgi:DNA-binding transcriptional LysR family regulator
MERFGRPWHIVCSSGSLSGLRAAALAGLGITPQAQGLIPDGLEEMPASGLPPLGNVEFVVRAARRAKRGPVAELAQALAMQGGRLRP